MSAATPLPCQPSLQEMGTAELRLRESRLAQRMETLRGQALVIAESKYDAIVTELEDRLRHITDAGQQIPIRFELVNGQTLAYRADGLRPDWLGQGSDAWEARDELQQMHDDWSARR